ncbi:MAG: methyltransferase domain-containing protein [Anaerolineae bacterium]|nr:methyltransferase domain-containing protein [Anaerolineae bacterium]
MTRNSFIGWYNIFSRVYDRMNDYPYGPVRQQAINAIDLQPGDTVLDLFCGTGVNFEHLLPLIGDSGRIIAVDGSEGMLEKARARTAKQGWDPEQIQLYQQNLLELDADFIQEHIPSDKTLKVLITLGVAGTPEWTHFWDTLFATVPEQTPFVTMDVKCAPHSLSAYTIGFLGSGRIGADIGKLRPWEMLKARCTDYHEQEYAAFRLLRSSVIVASGKKPTN